MLKRAVKILPVILFCLLATACKNNSPIKIGLSVELSGVNGDLGIPLRNGAQLAVDEINALGGINGREIILLVKDDEGDPDKANRVDKDLIDQNVVAIVGHATSEITSSVLELINSEDVLLISGSATGTEFTGLDDNFLRLTVDTRKFSLASADHIIQTQANKDILILYSVGNQAFVDPFITNFIEAYTEQGGNIIDILPVCCSASEIQEFVTSLKEANPVKIMAVATAFDLALILQYSDQIDFHPVWFSTLWAGTSELIHKGGRTADGVELIMSFSPQHQGADYLNFYAAYQERFGKEPALMSVTGYTIIHFLSAALAETDGEYEGLKESLLAINQINSIQGEIFMDEFGDVNRELHIARVIDGQFVIIGSVLLDNE